MEQISIAEVSAITKLSKHTLRYYDSIGLVKPLRGQGNYRYYTERDIVDLKYISVMKYGGFSLEQIKQIFQNRKSTTNRSAHMESTLDIIDQKQRELQSRIRNLEQVVQLLQESQRLLQKKQGSDESEIIAMILRTFQAISEDRL